MKFLEKKTSVREKKEMERDKLEKREGKKKKIMVMQQGLLRRQISQRCLGFYSIPPVAVLFCFNLPTFNAFTIELLLSMIS